LQQRCGPTPQRDLEADSPTSSITLGRAKFVDDRPDVLDMSLLRRIDVALGDHGHLDRPTVYRPIRDEHRGTQRDTIRPAPSAV
jgi:hypothetical protein